MRRNQQPTDPPRHRRRIDANLPDDIVDLLPIAGRECGLPSTGDEPAGCPTGFKCVGGDPDQGIPGRCRPTRKAAAAGGIGVGAAALLLL